jgi:hypothetical protein
MTPSDASSYRYLTQRPRDFLDDFYRRDDEEFENPGGLQDLRDLIRSGDGEPEILDVNRFKISLSAKKFSGTICKRVFYSSVRVAKLCAAVNALQAADCAAAWTLTTSYYSSFFAALELLFLDGRFSSFVDGDDIAAIQLYSRSSVFKLSKGTYECEVKWDEKDESVSVFYSHGSDKPHAFAWEKMRQYVDGIEGLVPLKSVPQWILLRRVLGSGGDRWRLPSDTRNRWNYTDSRLFTKEGDSVCNEFCTNCYQPTLAVKWISRNPRIANEQDYATSIAYLKAVLVAAYLDLARAVLPPKRLAEIQRLYAI